MRSLGGAISMMGYLNRVIPNLSQASWYYFTFNPTLLISESLSRQTMRVILAALNYCTSMSISLWCFLPSLPLSIFFPGHYVTPNLPIFIDKLISFISSYFSYILSEPVLNLSVDKSLSPKNHAIFKGRSEVTVVLIGFYIL